MRTLTMNKIAKLIKAKTIEFTKVLIENYKAVGLNEVSAVIVAKLYYLAEENENFLSIEKLSKEVTLDIEALSNEIINLVNKGYIDLNVDNRGRETFTLDGIIEKIGEVLQNGSDESLLRERQEKLSLIVQYVETTFGRNCSAADLVIINAWLDSNYQYDDVKDAVFQAFKLGKTNLKYVDAILANKAAQQKKPTVEVDEDIKAILDTAYVKK